jgi:hypothetical protein
MAFLDKYDEEQGNPNLTVSGKSEPAPEKAQQPQDSAKPDELTPDDIPDVEGQAPDAQSEVEEFEIVHDGTQHKLTRAKAIELAQQGFDYTQKTQAVAQAAKLVQERYQRVQAVEQIQPLLAQDIAQVTALESQLRQYQNVDWVAHARSDPIQYSQDRAQYDVLVNAYQQAAGRAQQKAQTIAQQKQALDAQYLESEGKKLFAAIPEWSDPAKYQAGAQELRSYLASEGVPQSDIDSLNNSTAVKIARKAMLYDKLLKAKKDNVKQLRTAPPVPRPGASTTAPKGEQANDAMRKLQKTGDQRDAIEALLNRWK